MLELILKEGEMSDVVEWYLPVSQAADILGCHRREIYRLAATGLLAYISLPGRGGIRISEKSMSAASGLTAEKIPDGDKSWQM